MLARFFLEIFAHSIDILKNTIIIRTFGNDTVLDQGFQMGIPDAQFLNLSIVGDLPASYHGQKHPKMLDFYHIKSSFLYKFCKILSKI